MDEKITPKKRSRDEDKGVDEDRRSSSKKHRKDKKDKKDKKHPRKKKDKKERKGSKSSKKSSRKDSKKDKKKRDRRDDSDSSSSSSSSSDSENGGADSSSEDDGAPRSVITGKRIQMSREVSLSDQLLEIERAAKRHYMNSQY